MKQLLMATTALTVMAVSAHAASAWKTTDNNKGLVSSAAKVTSVTTPSQLGNLTIDPTKNIVVSAKGSANASATISYMDSSGNVLYSQNFAVGTTPAILISPAAPQYFTRLGVSITTALSNDNVSVTAIQTSK